MKLVQIYSWALAESSGQTRKRPKVWKKSENVRSTLSRLFGARRPGRIFPFFFCGAGAQPKTFANIRTKTAATHNSWAWAELAGAKTLPGKALGTKITMQCFLHLNASHNVQRRSLTLSRRTKTNLLFRNCRPKEKRYEKEMQLRKL